MSVEQEAADRGRAELRPIFRAVGKTGSRRALRLERVFWDILRDVAKANHASIASIVEELAAGEAAIATNSELGDPGRLRELAAGTKSRACRKSHRSRR